MRNYTTQWLETQRTGASGASAISDKQILETMFQDNDSLKNSYSAFNKRVMNDPSAPTRFLDGLFYNGDTGYSSRLQKQKQQEPEDPPSLVQSQEQKGGGFIGTLKGGLQSALAASGITRAPQNLARLGESEFGQTVQAPTKLLAGLAGKGLEATGIPGVSDIAGKMDVTQEIPENIARTGDFMRTALPLSAGIATAPISLPLTAITSFLAGTAGSAIEDITDEEKKSFADITLTALKTGGVDALIDTLSFGALKGLGMIKKTPIGSKIDDVIGKIVQSKKASDLIDARKALSTLDTTGVKTWDDLTNITVSTRDALVKAQDEILGAIPDKYTLKQLTETIEAGGKKAKRNPVETALEHLNELYSKTGETEKLLKIQAIKEVAQKEGLTVAQINQIARDYGRDMPKAFGKTGEQLTSVNATLHENTRKQVKDAARNLLPNDASKALDESMSALYTLERLTEKASESARGISNRIEERGLISKAASAIGGSADKLLGRAPSSIFTSFLIRGNVGQKTLNALQIEKNLAKNLKLLESLESELAGVADDRAVDILVKFIKDNKLLETSAKVITDGE
jgi:hypothetical protein